MKSKNIFLIAALAFTMSAIAVPTADAQAVQTQAAKSSPATGTYLRAAIPIASLPITITKPGFYYFITNMYTYPTVATPAGSAPEITVNSPGNVIIDLNGFTLSGPSQAYVDGWYANPAGIIIESSNVTVKNGTVAGFFSPLNASIPSEFVQNYLSHIRIQSVTFTGGYMYDINFSNVNTSTVNDCNFGGTASQTAIIDRGSQTGNSYINDTFPGPQLNPIQIMSNAPFIVHSITPE